MPFTERDHEEILAALRISLREAGFGALDERIAKYAGEAQGAFGRLAYYMKLLAEEVSLGSDEHVAGILRRLRFVETESGAPVQSSLTICRCRGVDDCVNF
jgi:hypothetical protein